MILRLVMEGVRDLREPSTPQDLLRPIRRAVLAWLLRQPLPELLLALQG